MVSQCELTEPLESQDLPGSTLTWPVCDRTHRRRYTETGVSHIRATLDPIFSTVTLWDIRGNSQTHIGSLLHGAPFFLLQGENDVSMDTSVGNFVNYMKVKLTSLSGVLSSWFWCTLWRTWEICAMALLCSSSVRNRYHHWKYWIY